ncbi:MAG TPA: M20/M25/M40 family metallo-hydrolase [Gemmatimonadales bacterium]|nr:M20/M25/M40 family metallo-hydrolase [Gemmatimonadales bacterium]
MQRLSSAAALILVSLAGAPLAGRPLAAQVSGTMPAAPVAQWRVAVDSSGVGAVVRQATEHSEVMQNLQYLSDQIGPRLTGSPAMRRSNEWTAERFRAYGIPAHLEAWPFGVTWTRGDASLKLLAPFPRTITAESWAWTAGTDGRTLTGPVVRIDGSQDLLAANLARVKGAWVMLAEPQMLWNPDGPPMTAMDSAEFRQAQERRAAQFRRIAADTTGRLQRELQQFNFDRAYRLKAAGALGILTDGAKDFDLLTMSGSPNSVSPLPNLVIGHEDYLMLDRQLKAGVTPRLAGRVANTLGTTAVEQWNTVAEIKGSEKPDEVVILGAHLDSWDLGQGTTDNGTGSMVVLEAARAIQQAGVKPKRSIRFILFSGEEQGLLGSRAYARAHQNEADKIQAVLVLDNGTGRITAQALQGQRELQQLWKDMLAPLAPLGADSVRDANKGGTDHLAFLPYGVPGFNFDQETRGYNHTHHSQVDTYDHAVPGDLKQASAVMAATALQLANLPALLPRRAKSAELPWPMTPMKPSPGVVAGKAAPAEKAAPAAKASSKAASKAAAPTR